MAVPKLKLTSGMLLAGAMLAGLVQSSVVNAQNSNPMGVSIECWNGTRWLPCSSGGGVPAAPYQFTSPGAMQSQLAVTTSAVVTLTVPSGTAYFDVCVRSGAASSINFSVDGVTTPTTTATGNGKQLNAGQCLGYSGAALANNFEAIAATATTAIDVEYLK